MPRLQENWSENMQKVTEQKGDNILLYFISQKKEKKRWKFLSFTVRLQVLNHIPGIKYNKR